MYSQARYQQEDYYEDQGGYRQPRGGYNAQVSNPYSYRDYEDYEQPYSRTYGSSQEKYQPRRQPSRPQYDHKAYDEYDDPPRRQISRTLYDDREYDDYPQQRRFSNSQSYDSYPSQAYSPQSYTQNTPPPKKKSIIEHMYDHWLKPKPRDLNDRFKTIEEHMFEDMNRQVTCYACKGPHYRYQCQKYPYCKKCKTNFPCECRYKHHWDEVDQECNAKYPPYSQDHQNYPYYSNHYENEEYMMQPYEEENTEDMKNKILARIEELEQEMTNIREGWKQKSRQRTSSLGQETQASIQTLEDQMAQVVKCGNEEEDTHGNTFEPTRGSEYENGEEKESVEGKENSETKKMSEEEAPVLVENLIHERENQIRVQVQEESDDDVEIVWEEEKPCGDTIELACGKTLDPISGSTTLGDKISKSWADMCDENNDYDDIGVPIHVDNANIDCVDDGVENVVDMTSENNCIIEDVDNEVNFFNPCVFNDSDSFDSSDDDDGNCFDTCENNSFVSLDDNDVLSLLLLVMNLCQMSLLMICMRYVLMMNRMLMLVCLI